MDSDASTDADADVAEFDVVVLGGGSGSQVATAAAESGLEAAVCEPGPLGGACVTRGCVPSKALIHRAEVLDEIRRAARFGIDAAVRDVDFSAITDEIHETVYEKADRQRERIDASETLTLYEAAGRFVDDRTIAIGGDEDGRPDGSEERRVRGDHVVIAVGGRPTVPPIDGLEEVDFLTSDDALFLDSRPDDLVIVGGGYIAVELGFFFSALGTDVSIVGRSDVLVSREDEAVSEAVTRSLETRLDVYAGYEATSVSRPADGDGVSIEVESGDGETLELSAGELLVAAGRRPNTDTLDLENTDVETDEAGHVEVDGRLETTAENVWALGDVLVEQPFKHVADYEARVVTQNVLEDAGETVDYAGMPHAIFTAPQVASVGRTTAELDEQDREYEETLVTYDAAPMGMILAGGGRRREPAEVPERFVKVLAAPDGAILGCHVVGPQASTMIHEVVLALQQGSGTVDEIADTVHVHPALNEAVLKAFDEAASREYSTAPDWRHVAGHGDEK